MIQSNMRKTLVHRFWIKLNLIKHLFMSAKIPTKSVLRLFHQVQWHVIYKYAARYCWYIMREGVKKIFRNAVKLIFVSFDTTYIRTYIMPCQTVCPFVESIILKCINFVSFSGFFKKINKRKELIAISYRTRIQMQNVQSIVMCWRLVRV